MPRGDSITRSANPLLIAPRSAPRCRGEPLMWGRKRRAATRSKLPDFLAVGPPRTVTTWLWRALRDCVGTPRYIKETDFSQRNYAMGIDAYANLFSRFAPGRPAGEVCPSYFASLEAIERVARHIPRCKVIVTLREPVARAWSHYRLLRFYGLCNPPFAQIARV